MFDQKNVTSQFWRVKSEEENKLKVEIKIRVWRILKDYQSIYSVGCQNILKPKSLMIFACINNLIN